MNMARNLLAVLALSFIQNAPAMPLDEPSASPDAGIACPSEDFPSFIHAYMDNEAIQRKFIRYPLPSLYVDATAEPEPKEIVETLQRGQVEFPIMPSSQEQKDIPLELKIIDMKATEAKVLLFQPGTDYGLIFYFQKNACWELVRKEDHSL